MVEVFKTNVQDQSAMRHLTDLLHLHFPGCRIVFDLDDCDRILKVAGETFSPDAITGMLQRKGFSCEVLAE